MASGRGKTSNILATCTKNVFLRKGKEFLAEANRMGKGAEKGTLKKAKKRRHFLFLN